MTLSQQPRERVQRLIEAARRATAPGAARRELQTALARSTRLSEASIEWALERCLELSPEPAELDALVSSAAASARAHVILPSNVFIAAHRALAVALAAAPRVYVKPSRRELVFVRALAAADADLFELVDALAVEPGDRVWAYGSDTTLQSLRRELPRGARLHAHGDGFGVALVDLTEPGAAAQSAAVSAGIAHDVAGFDQRGCLSPRFVFVRGGLEPTLAFAGTLARALDQLERTLPRGELELDELADAAWYRQCAACFGPVLSAGAGAVSVRAELPNAGAAALDVPPSGRHIEVVRVDEFGAVLAALSPWLTSVAASHPKLAPAVLAAAPRARLAQPGEMQRPPFDGPADRRADPSGELLS